MRNVHWNRPARSLATSFAVAAAALCGMMNAAVAEVPATLKLGLDTPGTIAYGSGGAKYVSELGEQCNGASSVSDDEGYVYVSHATSTGNVSKLKVDWDTGAITNLGFTSLPLGYDFANHLVLNKTTGYLYCWTWHTVDPYRLVKISKGSGDALPQFVTSLDSPQGEARAMAIDESTNIAYVIHFGGKVVKYNLGTGAAAPTVIGTATLNSVSRNFSAIALNTTTGHFYVAESENGARFYKGTMGAPSAAPTVIGNVSLKLNHRALCIDAAADKAYIAYDDVGGELEFARVSLGAGAALPTLDAFLETGLTATRANSLEIDPANGHGFILAGTTGSSQQRIVKVALNATGGAPTVLGTSTPTTGSNAWTSNHFVLPLRRAVTVSTGYPDTVSIHDLGVPSTHTATSIGSLRLNGTGSSDHAFLVDEAARVGYQFGDDFLGTVSKIDLGTSVTTGALISQATVTDVSMLPRGAALDPAGTHFYIVVGANSAQYYLEKWATGTGAQAPSKQHRVTLPFPTSSGTLLFADPLNRCLYLGTYETPGKVYKVDMGTGDDVPVVGASVTLGANENRPSSGWIDTATNTGYVVTAAQSGEGARIVKLDLGVGAAAPTRVGTVILPNGETGFGQTAIDSANRIAYLADVDSSSSKIVKVNMGGTGAAPTRVGSLDLGSSAWYARSLAMDPATGLLYTLSSGSNAVPPYLYVINPGAPAAAMTSLGTMQMPAGSHSPWRSWYDNASEQLLISATPGNLFKVATRQPRGLRLVGYPVTRLVRFGTMNFYSHAIGGNLRLVMYAQHNGNIGDKIWESPWIANDAAPGWIAVPITNGVTSDPLQIDAPEGAVYLGWISDTDKRVAGYQSGNCHFIAGDLANFPDSIDQAPSYTSSGRWSQYVTYATTPDIVLPSVADADNANSPSSGYTNDRTVALEWYDQFSPADSAEITEDQTFTTYTTVLGGNPHSYTLAAGADGLRTIYIRTRNELGVSPAHSVTITLDTQPASLLTAGPVITNDNRPPVSGTYVEANPRAISVVIAGQTRSVPVTPLGTWTLADNSLSTVADGTHNIAVTITDHAGNISTNTFTGALTIDRTAPTMALGAPSVTLSGAGPIDFPLTYTGADSVTLAPANVTLTKTGSANATVQILGTGFASRTIRLQPLTGTGTIRINVAAGTGSDLAGNAVVAASGLSATVTVDNTSPVLSSMALTSASVLAGAPVTGTYAAADNIAVTTSTLYLRHEGGTWFAADSTLTAATWSVTPPTPGAYTATLAASDAVGNTSPVPSGSADASTPTVSFVWGAADNQPITLQLPTGSAITRTFPVAPGLEITITFNSVIAPGDLTIQRVVGDGAPLGVDPAKLIDEYWILTPSPGLQFDTATLSFEYGSTNLGGLAAADITHVLARDATLRIFTTPQVTNNTGTHTITVTGVTGFSTWYIGSVPTVVTDWCVID